MARRLALIAHDNKKVDFVAWATFNRETLAQLDTALAHHGSVRGGAEIAA